MERPKRKSNRLRGYDYSQNGLYFITVCVEHMEKLWQRSFYDHVVRNEQDFLRILSYLDSNPVRWEQDRFYCP